MADRVIWDFESFQSIHSRIWDAADTLDDCRRELRAICREAEDVLGMNGPVSRRILDNTESLLRRTANLSWRAQELADASAEANFKLRQSERELEHGMDDLERGNGGTETASATVIPQHTPRIWTGWRPYLAQMILLDLRHYYCTPAWLIESIDSANGAK